MTFLDLAERRYPAYYFESNTDGHADDDTAEIKRMFVSSFFRGRGIARSVLGELETWALENNFHQAILETAFNQPEALALYRGAGYTPIPNYGPYQAVSGCICMKKDLAFFPKI